MEDLTKKEEVFSSEFDLEPKLNENEDFPHFEKQWHLMLPKKRAKNLKADTIDYEHIICSGRVTLFRLPCRLQRDGTQIRKTRYQAGASSEKAIHVR